MVWRPRLGRSFRVGRAIRHISRFEGQNRQERGKIKSKKGKRENIERTTGAKGERSSRCRISKWTGGGSGRATDTNSGQSSGCRGRGEKYTVSRSAHLQRPNRKQSINEPWCMAEQAKLAKELEAEERNLRKCTEEVFETERKKQEQGKQRRRRSAKPRTLQRLPDVRTKPSTGHGRGNRYGGAKAQLIEVTEIHV